MSDTEKPRREIRITTTMTAFFFVAVFAVIVIVGWLDSGRTSTLTKAPPRTVTAESKSALPTNQDMVEACKDSIKARMATNPRTPGEVLWNTAEVASAKDYPGLGLYDVTGTGTLDNGVQTPFAFTCLVEFGPPTVAVDNGFELWP